MTDADHRPEKLRLALIYDASSLMSDGFVHLPDKYWGSAVVDWTLFVPTEVEADIRRLSDDPAREQAANRARKRIASFLEAGCKEVRLQDVAEPLSLDETTGAAGDVAQRIVGLARKLVQQGRYAAVFVASEDGGILSDVVRLRKKHDLPIYGVAQDRFQKSLQTVHELAKPVSEQFVQWRESKKRFVDASRAILLVTVLVYLLAVYRGRIPLNAMTLAIVVLFAFGMKTVYDQYIGPGLHRRWRGFRRHRQRPAGASSPAEPPQQESPAQDAPASTDSTTPDDSRTPRSGYAESSPGENTSESTP